MSQISFVNQFSINPYNNAELKRQYMRHKSRIEQIGKKGSPFSSIQQQQMRIIEVVHKSKQLSRKFQQHEFSLRKSIENKRMMNHLSRVEHRKHSTLQEAEEALINKKTKTNAKEEIMRQFQIKLDNKKMSQHLQEYSVNKKKYRKKVQQEVEQYEKLRFHMQKFKHSKSSNSRMSTRKQINWSNRANTKSKNNMEALFFNEDNKLTPMDHRMNKSRSLPPLQLIVV